MDVAKLVKASSACVFVYFPWRDEAKTFLLYKWPQPMRDEKSRDSLSYVRDFVKHVLHPLRFRF